MTASSNTPRSTRRDRARQVGATGAAIHARLPRTFADGALIGGLAWLVVSALAGALSVVVSSPIGFVTALLGLGLYLVLALVPAALLGGLAALLAARTASRLSARSALIAAGVLGALLGLGAEFLPVGNGVSAWVSILSAAAAATAGAFLGRRRATRTS